VSGRIEIPVLYRDQPLPPRTETQIRYSDGRAFGAPLAEAAGSIEQRLIRMTDVAASANRDLAAALVREIEADHRAADAEARLQIAQGVAIAASRRQRATTIDVAMDRAAQVIAGRTAARVAADLDEQMGRFPDDDDDTIIVREPMTSDEIAVEVAKAREHRLERDALVALADLVDRWLELTMAIEQAERAPGCHASYATYEALDAAEIALARAVRP
jgi:hypothetical protein